MRAFQFIEHGLADAHSVLGRCNTRPWYVCLLPFWAATIYSWSRQVAIQQIAMQTVFWFKSSTALRAPVARLVPFSLHFLARGRLSEYVYADLYFHFPIYILVYIYIYVYIYLHIDINIYGMIVRNAQSCHSTVMFVGCIKGTVAPVFRQPVLDILFGDNNTFTLFCPVRPNGVDAVGVFHEGVARKVFPWSKKIA